MAYDAMGNVVPLFEGGAVAPEVEKKMIVMRL
jgi:hypothetical protein